MTDVSQTTSSIPMLITALTATNTMLVAAVAFFLSRFFKRFDEMAKNVEQHSVVLGTSQTQCNERSSMVNAALLDLQNDQDRQDEIIGDHSRLIAEHGVEIANIKKYIPRK